MTITRLHMLNDIHEHTELDSFFLSYCSLGHKLLQIEILYKQWKKLLLDSLVLNHFNALMYELWESPTNLLNLSL